MWEDNSIIPVKKTQSKFLDQLIQHQCNVNEKNRVIHEQTMHLRNAMVNSDSTGNNRHYYSQTASSQAKKKLHGKSNDDQSKELTKPQQVRPTSRQLTQPRAFQFHSRSRSSRTKQRAVENDKTENSIAKLEKISYSSNVKTVINKEKRVRSASAAPKPKKNVTKVVGFSFATDTRRHRRLSKTKDGSSHLSQGKSGHGSRVNGRRDAKQNVSQPRFSQSRGQRKRSNDTYASRFSSKRVSASKPANSQRKVSMPQNFGAFKQSVTKNASSTDLQNKRSRKSTRESSFLKRSSRTSAKSVRTKIQRMQAKPTQKAKHTKQKAKHTIAKTSNPVAKNDLQLSQSHHISQSSSVANKTKKCDASKPKRQRQRSLTDSQMKRMLAKQLSCKKETDWNKVYVQANRKRSRSLTRSSSNSSLNQSNIGARTSRRRGRSASFNNVRYADFVENYALHALLTDDASRISDEDLKALSRNASENNSINTSPVNSSGFDSYDSDGLTFSQLLEHDMSMLSSELVDPNANSEYDSKKDSDNNSVKSDVVTDVKDRFLKLDHLFGQISAAIEEGESTWIQ